MDLVFWMKIPYLCIFLDTDCEIFQLRIFLNGAVLMRQPRFK